MRTPRNFYNSSAFPAAPADPLGRSLARHPYEAGQPVRALLYRRSAVPALCCNGWVAEWTAMGAVIYLALVGGGLTAAFLLTVLLRGIRLI